MVVSPFRTQFTRMVQNGERSPSINMDKNDKSSRSIAGGFRRERWLSKKGKNHEESVKAG